MIEVTLAGIKQRIQEAQLKFYESIGWKQANTLGANQETPQPQADGAIPPKKPRTRKKKDA